jgi:hypothetical protein
MDTWLFPVPVPARAAGSHTGEYLAGILSARRVAAE